MGDKRIQIFEMQFSVDQMFDIARALIADDQRFDHLSIDNRVKLCLIALNDYADGMECGKNLSSLKFDEIDDIEERAVSKAMHCLYLELRSRATKHNEELSKKYLAAHQAILKRSLRTMKKEELKLFMDAVSE